MLTAAAASDAPHAGRRRAWPDGCLPLTPVPPCFDRLPVTLGLCHHIRALRYVLSGSFDAMEALLCFHPPGLARNRAGVGFYFGGPGLGADARPWASGGNGGQFSSMDRKQMTSRALRTHSLVLPCAFPACTARPRPPAKPLSRKCTPLSFLPFRAGRRVLPIPAVDLLTASAQLGHTAFLLNRFLDLVVRRAALDE